MEAEGLRAGGIFASLKRRPEVASLQETCDLAGCGPKMYPTTYTRVSVHFVLLLRASRTSLGADARTVVRREGRRFHRDVERGGGGRRWRRMDGRTSPLLARALALALALALAHAHAPAPAPAPAHARRD